MKKRKINNIISFNSPIILGLALSSFIVLILNVVTNGEINKLFAIYYTSWADPMMYVRLFTHTLAHQDLSHYSANFLLLLAVGPLVEEKYGSKNVLIMILTASAIIGLINIIFFPHTMLLGASGIVFMFILLASFANVSDGRIPLTVILVGMLYIGNEVISSMITSDNISRMAHIIGGLLGALFGVLFHMDRLQNKKEKSGY
ncbi:rhomboid family intramembrane serine protease [Enterococcus sp. AZ163]|uniref:rhomboid family intramembrane serine protease n=1 Tax=Enterococcus sp. AZ163 TaxID=2774638 RepID=UPI003D29B2E4